MSTGQPPTKAFCLTGSRCWFWTGSLTYYHVDRIRFGDQGTPALGGSMEIRDTPVGVWLIAVAPIEGGDEQSAKNSILSATGLVSAWGGRNATYEKYFDFFCECSVDRTSVCSPIILNPAALRSPDFCTVMELDALSDGIFKLSFDDRSRIELALRWFADSFHRFDVDALLSLWVALEVLTMSGTNVKDTNNVLSRAYCISVARASERFLLGRLHGYRSKIVHDGGKGPVHHLLLDYLEAVFVDCLYHSLGQVVPKRAYKLLSQQEHELQRILQES